MDVPHDHVHGGETHVHGPGHNRTATHLHSHKSPQDEAADLQALCSQFIEGFTQATDKAAFLKLAGVPPSMPSETGGAPVKLIDVQVTSRWGVAAASPAFGSAELSYLPYPGALIKERVDCTLVYVSLTERRDVDLRDLLKPSLP